MPHGHPDYGAGAPTSTIYPVLDIGELAARLGSVNTFDRRGNVVFLEDFQGSLAKCEIETTGAAGSVTISNERALHGDFSCKMVTNPAAGDRADLYVRLAYPVLSSIGMEVSWDMVDSSLLDDIHLYLQLYDGIDYHWAAVRWVASTGTWYYHDSSGWVSLTPTQTLYSGNTHFNITKLVVDFVNEKYVRLISNSRVYDLSDIAYGTLPSATAPQLLCIARVYALTDAACTVYPGHMIITQNEP